MDCREIYEIALISNLKMAEISTRTDFRILTGDGKTERNFQKFHDKEYTISYSLNCNSYRVDELLEFSRGNKKLYEIY